MGPRLDFERFLIPIDWRPDLVPLIDLGFLGLFAALAASPFLVAPGVGVDLLALPGATRAGVPTVGAVTVLTVREGNRVLFNGEIFDLGRAAPRLQRYVRERGAAGATLLVLVDRSVDLEPVLALMEQARAAGFGGVQLAVREQVEAGGWRTEGGAAR